MDQEPKDSGRPLEMGAGGGPYSSGSAMANHHIPVELRDMHCPTTPSGTHPATPSPSAQDEANKRRRCEHKAIFWHWITSFFKFFWKDRSKSRDKCYHEFENLLNTSKSATKSGLEKFIRSFVMPHEREANKGKVLMIGAFFIFDL